MEKDLEPLRSGKADALAGATQSEKSPSTEIADIAPTVDGKTSDEESMSIDDLLATITNDSTLPSSAGVVTKIQFGKKSSRHHIARTEAARAQNVVLMTDIADNRKEVQELKAALSNDILDFRAQAQENYNTLTTQLSELVDYINRGGNDKKGESCSRGLQPSPDDRDRSGSGGSDGRNRGGRSESSRKRHYSSGGPHKRDVDYWLGGKR
ncbi:hypothetical protein F511_31065 [Dorcoceras hygrometricum]|uniref:Uncharacterized protein n=1 Tax=Dorcoceras hygrometricum TaxID=472368 RepID=A0A2Z7DA26_9LAMI|nr:hypothetical protein F511_31065 [Dorcoceras hygrometricum]